MSWQDISTAPKDGTWVLVKPGWEVTMPCAVSHYSKYIGGWLRDNVGLYDHTPTHWMPLDCVGKHDFKEHPDRPLKPIDKLFMQMMTEVTGCGFVDVTPDKDSDIAAQNKAASESVVEGV